MDSGIQGHRDASRNNVTSLTVESYPLHILRVPSHLEQLLLDKLSMRSEFRAQDSVRTLKVLF